MLIDVYKDIINPEVVLPIDTSVGTLTLKEPDVCSKIKKLYINNVPEESFAFTLDFSPNKTKKKIYSKLSNYLNPKNKIGINKSCDLVILFKDNNWKIILLELKSDRPVKLATEKQLINSELFIKYLELMIAQYYPETNGKINTFNKTVVVTSNRNIPKNSTYRPSMKPIKNIINYLHTSVLSSKEAHIHFNQLI